MDGLIAFYQLLRGSVILPVVIGVAFFALLAIERKLKGKVRFGSYLWFGITGLLWGLFAIFNFIFEQSPFTALPEIVYIGLPLFIFSVNSLLFWLFGCLGFGSKNENAI